MRYWFVLVAIAASSTAAADPTVYSAVKGDYTALLTLPNGKVEKRKLGDGSASVSKESFLVPPGVDKLSLRVVDAAGKEVWKTTTGPNDVYVLIPSGKKVTGVFAGHASGVGETPKAAGFMSISPVDITLDLIGQNGLGAHRGIQPGKAFDPGRAIKLDPKETYFGVEVKLKDAAVTVRTAAKVEAGRYYLVSTHPREGFRLLSLGYMPRPAAATKKK